jgi:hypothetical protein
MDPGNFDCETYIYTHHFERPFNRKHMHHMPYADRGALDISFKKYPAEYRILLIKDLAVI